MTVSRACQPSCVFDHLASLRAKKYRKTTKAKAEPNSDAGPATAKPLIPYATPHRFKTVLWPIAGGNETKTELSKHEASQKQKSVYKSWL